MKRIWKSSFCFGLAMKTNSMPTLTCLNKRPSSPSAELMARWEIRVILLREFEMWAGVGSKSTKTERQQCSLSRFKTISTTHLAQGPLKTHNIKHRYCIYTHNKNSKGKQGNTDHCLRSILCNYFVNLKHLHRIFSPARFSEYQNFYSVWY